MFLLFLSTPNAFQLFGNVLFSTHGPFAGNLKWNTWSLWDNDCPLACFTLPVRVGAPGGGRDQCSCSQTQESDCQVSLRPLRPTYHFDNRSSTLLTESSSVGKRMGNNYSDWTSVSFYASAGEASLSSAYKADFGHYGKSSRNSWNRRYAAGLLWPSLVFDSLRYF